MVQALWYAGGKQRLASWINEILPRTNVYVEPFAGMLGVLLSRPPVKIEVVNDLDERIVNWWRVVRDRPDDLERALTLTPYSRSEYDRSAELLDSGGGNELDRAVALTVVLQQSYYSKSCSNTWLRPTRYRSYWSIPERIQPLAERLRHVGLEQGDGVTILDAYRQRSDTVLYCDPPYPGAEIYRHDLDRSQFIDSVLDESNRAFIAVSGFSDSWPELDDAGWTKITKRRPVRLSLNGGEEHIETVWTNRPVNGVLDLWSR